MFLIAIDFCTARKGSKKKKEQDKKKKFKKKNIARSGYKHEMSLGRDWGGGISTSVFCYSKNTTTTK